MGAYHCSDQYDPPALPGLTRVSLTTAEVNDNMIPGTNKYKSEGTWNPIMVRAEAAWDGRRIWTDRAYDPNWLPAATLELLQGD